MTSSGSHARPRLPATIVAVIVLLCQGTAWVHAAATPHVTCLEHGESIHLAADAHAAPPDASSDLQDVVSTPSEAAAHAHEHCNLQGQRTTSSAAPAPTFVRAVPARAVTQIAPFVAGPVGLLRFAPKTSPPVTAAV
jgi:hypothetical protein